MPWREVKLPWYKRAWNAFANALMVAAEAIPYFDDIEYYDAPVPKVKKTVKKATGRKAKK